MMLISVLCYYRGVVCDDVFVFKQKTAYEIEYGLGGSEMCIRDGTVTAAAAIDIRVEVPVDVDVVYAGVADVVGAYISCLLYTSDAADERSSVDLGGRRIIKKKNTE